MPAGELFRMRCLSSETRRLRAFRFARWRFDPEGVGRIVRGMHKSLRAPLQVIRDLQAL
jgi:hypothetical protein